MTTMTPRDLPLPDNSRVRLVDLPVQAGGAIAVDEDGFVNIYLNARLSREAQRKALQHELRHHYRGDLYSDEDIRAVERAAGGRGLRAVDGTPLDSPAPPFEEQGLMRVGRGLYLPTGENLTRAAAHLDQLRGALEEACRIYDVMQTPPLLPSKALMDLAASLGAGDIAFIAWQPVSGRCTAVLHFSRETLYGAVYYDASGRPENALAVMTVGEVSLTVDVRCRNGRLEVYRILREQDDRTERIY